MTKPNFANNLELADTVKVGNRMAAELMQNRPRPTYESAIRFARAENGTQAAIDLAISLGYSEPEAHAFVKHIERTKPDGVATPYSDKWE